MEPPGPLRSRHNNRSLNESPQQSHNLRARASEETSPRTVVVSPEEKAAFQEAVNQPGADPMIALGEKFLQDYPESQLRSHVYSALATAYQQKNDYDKVVENGEKSIALDPDNVMSLGHRRADPSPKAPRQRIWKRLKN